MLPKVDVSNHIIIQNDLIWLVVLYRTDLK